MRPLRALAASLLASTAVFALAACGAANGQGLAVTMGADPLEAEEEARRKPAPPPATEGAAPKERTLTSLLPGPPELEAGTTRIGFTTATDGGAREGERKETRRFVRGKYTELVEERTTPSGELDQRRLLGVGDVVYELGDGRCTAWHAERAAEQVAAGPPSGKLGTRPYPATAGGEPSGLFARFAAPFRARLMAADEVLDGRRADRYGVSLVAGETSGTAEVWVVRATGSVTASRGEVLVPSLGPDGLVDETHGEVVESWAALVVEADAPDELELPDDCRRAVVQPADAK